VASYRVCPNCGAHLDPEEKCDCRNGIADKEEVATSQPEREEENICQN